MAVAVDIVGKKIGSLTVVERSGSTSYGQSMWLCRCECGNEVRRPWASLKQCPTASCGCHHWAMFGDLRRCAMCREKKPLSEFSSAHRNRGVGEQINCYCKPCATKRSIEQYRKNPTPYLEYSKKVRDALKREILNAYGGVCACCGEAEVSFLAIDHINGGGTKHRRTLPKGGGFYKWLKAEGFPSGFQVLCMNCNWGKHVNGGVCPHQSKGAFG